MSGPASPSQVCCSAASSTTAVEQRELCPAVTQPPSFRFRTDLELELERQMDRIGLTAANLEVVNALDGSANPVAMLISLL